MEWQLEPLWLGLQRRGGCFYCSRFLLKAIKKAEMMFPKPVKKGRNEKDRKRVERKENQCLSREGCCQRYKSYWTFASGSGEISQHQSHCYLVGMPTSRSSGPRDHLAALGDARWTLATQDRDLWTCCLLS